jgi:hypothetical protein
MDFVGMPDQFPPIAKKSKISVHVDQRVVERLQMAIALSSNTSFTFVFFLEKL